MPYIVKRIGTLPAVIIKFYGEYDGHHTEEIEQQLESMFADEQGPIWRIMDASDFHLTFDVVWKSLVIERTAPRWTFNDERMRTVGVSSSEIAYLAARVVTLFAPKISVPLFSTTEEAVAYVRAEIEASQTPETHLQRRSG